MLKTVKTSEVVHLEAVEEEEVKQWSEKKMLGQLLRQLEREGFEINGTWNSTLKFSSATQEQALRTNYHVDKSVECAT